MTEKLQYIFFKETFQGYNDLANFPPIFKKLVAYFNYPWIWLVLLCF